MGFTGEASLLPHITFVQSSNSIEMYDFLDVILNVDQPNAQNPFTDAFVDASFLLSLSWGECHSEA
jgi:hypothetical protein